MADMGTLHSKGGQQVLSSYMHYGSPMLVGAQCNTSYTEHRPRSTTNLSPVSLVLLVDAQ